MSASSSAGSLAEIGEQSEPAAAPASWTATPLQVERVIAAVLPHSSRDRHIPVVCTVNLEIESSRFLAVACDRYTLGICWAQFEDWGNDDEPPGTLSARVYGDDLRRLFAFLKPRRKERATWTLSADELRVDIDGESASVRTVDVNFFDWRDLLSKRVAQPPSAIPRFGFNPDMLDHFTQTAKIIGGNKPTIWSFGDQPTSPPLVQIGDTFLGLLMPVRVPDDEPELDLGVIGIDVPKAVDEA